MAVIDKTEVQVEGSAIELQSSVLFFAEKEHPINLDGRKLIKPTMNAKHTPHKKTSAERKACFQLLNK